MQEYKKISVVTVAYNCEHFLETACKNIPANAKEEPAIIAFNIAGILI